MNLEEIRLQKQKALTFKDNIVRYQYIQELITQMPASTNFNLEDTIKIDCSSDETFTKLILEGAQSLKPWRKGPFSINELFIDTEWQSFIKYNLLRPHFDLKNKVVADVGCNNGYYMFRMLEDAPAKLVGFDPGVNFYLQFLYINAFLQTNIQYELLGIEHLPFYEHKFDFIFMLGVLYHRSDPIASLKSLAKSLNKNGEIIIDTFMIDGDLDIALTPKTTYSKIPNIYFIPTQTALNNWLERAGFTDMELLAITTTDKTEQRKTIWIDSQSLEDFLDPNDESKTVEGYPAPKRIYIKARLKN